VSISDKCITFLKCVLILCVVTSVYAALRYAYLPSLLVKAAVEGNDATLRTLLRVGVSANSVSHGNVALGAAAGAGNDFAVHVLIDNGANVDAPNARGIRPLEWALRGCHARVALTLLKHGANVKWVTREGRTPLSLTLTNMMVHDLHGTDWDTMIDEEIAHGIDINAHDSYIGAPLMYACARDDAYLAQKLIAAGAFVDPGDVNPLATAVQYDNIDLARLFLRHGVDAKARNADGTTALHAVKYCDAYDVINLLLAQGADATVKDREGKTPLDYAIENTRHKSIVLLRAAMRTRGVAGEATRLEE
jgi:uncharacterized protein